jgi:hypothetical protein
MLLSAGSCPALEGDLVPAKEGAMDKVVTLNRFRKAQAKADKSRQAAGNRAKHGRDKTQKQLVLSEQERRDRDLDGKKLR